MVLKAGWLSVSAPICSYRILNDDTISECMGHKTINLKYTITVNNYIKFNALAILVSRLFRNERNKKILF